MELANCQAIYFDFNFLQNYTGLIIKRLNARKKFFQKKLRKTLDRQEKKC